MANNVQRQWLVAFLLLAVLVFLAATWFYPLWPHKIELLRALAFGFSASVAVRCAGPAWKSLTDRTHYLHPNSMLTIGLGLLWIVITAMHLWTYLWRLHGQPAWMMNSDVQAFLVYMMMICAGLHILAPPGLEESRIQPRSKMLFVASTIIGVTFFVAMLLIGDEPVHWLDPIRSYIETKPTYGRQTTFSPLWRTA